MRLSRRFGGLFAGSMGVLRLRGACIGLVAALLLPVVFAGVDARRMPPGVAGGPVGVGVWVEQYLFRAGWPLPSGVERRPFPVDIVTRYGWPFPWYGARLANPPHMTLPRHHDEGWRLLIDEVDGAALAPPRWRSAGRFRVQLAGDLMMRTNSVSALSIRPLAANLLAGALVTLSLLALCISEPGGGSQ